MLSKQITELELLEDPSVHLLLLFFFQKQLFDLRDEREGSEA